MSQFSFSDSPVIALLTDFGLRDGYVGVMKGVILNIAARAQLIDITHDIAPQNVAQGSWVLAASYRYFPQGTIFLCVVDPGVGSKRRPLAIHAGSWFFVGPDNGLFGHVLAEQPLHKAVVLTNPAYHLPQVSATFQGRDIFAPAAAHIANGVVLRKLGTTIAQNSLQRPAIVYARREGERIQAQIVYVDHFGNLITNIPGSMVPTLFTAPALRLTFASSPIAITERRRFFADEAGQHMGDQRPFLYLDSAGYVGVAVQNGNAAATLGVEAGESVTLVIEET